MMGGGGGSRGSGTTTVQQGAPQLIPEARPGFEQAHAFFRDILGSPPIFAGERLAPVSGAQRGAIEQAKTSFGAPSRVQGAAGEQIGRTLEGGFLSGPEAQAAVSGLAAPLFAQFSEQILPGIRDRAQFSGAGVSGTRRGVAETSATEALGRGLGQGAVAPIFSGERGRQLEAAQLAPTVGLAEQQRLGALAGAGAQERGFAQEEIDVAREKFEEPLFRRSEAASALLGSSGVGPGGSTTQQSQRASESAGTVGTISQIAGIALPIIALALKSTREAKNITGLVEPNNTIPADILSMPIYRWSYKEGGKMRIGPVLEEAPSYLSEPDGKHLDVVTLFGAMLITMQSLAQRLDRIEARFDQVH